MSDKDFFERLLSDLKESLATPRTSEALLRIEPPQYQLPDSFYAAIKEEYDPLMLARQYGFCNGDDVLKVMNSEIFFEGGIKGAPLLGQKGQYKVWPIKDLAYFILEASTRLLMPELREIIQGSISAFDETIKQIDRLEFTCTAYISKVNLKKLVKIKKELNEIKSDLTTKNLPSLPMDINGREDRVDTLLQLFQEQVPRAPKSVISEAISLILKECLGFHITSSAVRQRIRRAKQK